MVNILKGQGGGLKDEHLKHTSINGVDIYSITSQQRSIPSWIGDKNKKVPRKVKQSKCPLAMVSLIFLISILLILANGWNTDGNFVQTIEIRLFYFILKP